ncbi:MAG: hypothetical protein N2645_16835 [Clostridia bacterium]|nr:hypothetical protein [Clostridia bacterium]
MSLNDYLRQNDKEKTFFMVFSYKDVLFLRKKIKHNSNLKIIFRPRGIVPEESYLKHKSNVKKKVLDYYERKAVIASDYFCFISDNQRQHFCSKYFKDDTIYGKSIVVHNYLEYKPLEKKNIRTEGKLRIVYSGGFSKWQQIDSIFELVKCVYNKLPNIEFNIYTLPKYIELAKEYANNYNISSICNVKSYDQSELLEKIALNDVGIILRNNSIVNVTSSPFKLIDYLGSRIGVILSDNIGDYYHTLKNKPYAMLIRNSNHNNFDYRVEEIIQFLTKLKDINKGIIENDLMTTFNFENEIKILCKLLEHD